MFRLQSARNAIRLRGMRADSGFCVPELLALWEAFRVPFVVVAQLSEPTKNLLRRDMLWMPTEVAGTEVAELQYRALHWPHARRLILVRHRQAERPGAGCKKLIDVPGYARAGCARALGKTLRR